MYELFELWPTLFEKIIKSTFDFFDRRFLQTMPLKMKRKVYYIYYIFIIYAASLFFRN
jgi:hypothetical protein